MENRFFKSLKSNRNFQLVRKNGISSGGSGWIQIKYISHYDKRENLSKGSNEGPKESSNSNLRANLKTRPQMNQNGNSLKLEFGVFTSRYTGNSVLRNRFKRWSRECLKKCILDTEFNQTGKLVVFFRSTSNISFEKVEFKEFSKSFIRAFEDLNKRIRTLSKQNQKR